VFEVGVSAEFRAIHVMPGMEGPEGRPHSHDYRLEVVATRAELDERGMVCDIDLLEAAIGRALEQVRDRHLDAIRPPDRDAVTVEVLARWAHKAIAGALGSGPDALAVRVWESPVAFGGYASALDNSSS
jgi:6-pyruvoyltetrahydropterin/6-carboxytetrahydropterin synthase